MPRSSVLFEDNKQTDISKQDNSHRQQVYKMIDGLATSPFSAMLSLPKVFNFSNQSDNEKIILVVRQHWYINTKWIIPFLLMIIAPTMLGFVPIGYIIPVKFQLISLSFWYLISFAFALEGFLSWWFNVFVVTEERVVDIDFLNLLNSKTSDAQLDKIQDVSYEIKGIAGTFLNFGTLLIQTAGEVPEIEIKNAPNPELIAKVLQTLRLEEQQEALEGRLK